MTNETEEFLIIEVSEDGEQITLSDNTVCSIHPKDIGKSACWYESQTVNITETTSKAYPYKLTNLDTSDSCKAKLA